MMYLALAAANAFVASVCFKRDQPGWGWAFLSIAALWLAASWTL